MKCPICGAEMVYVGKMQTFSKPSRFLAQYFCPKCGYSVLVPEGESNGE